MTQVPSDGFETRYKHLRAAYTVRLKDYAAAIDNILSQRERAPFTCEDVERAARIAHRLKGSGITFGYPEITQVAVETQTVLKALMTHMTPRQILSDDDFVSIRTTLLALRKSCVSQAEGTPVVGDEGWSGIRPQATGERVLVVDDDEDLCALIEAKLNFKGLDVDAARDGNAALSLLSERRYDLIILDVSMEGMGGQETLRRIKQNPDWLRIPVLMLTGSTQESDIASALHAGAMEYIFKPFDVDQLAEKVSKLLSMPRVNVMIVDDDELILELLESLYRGKGFNVLRAQDGLQALKLLETARPDLIVLDRQMPGMGGGEVLQDIRRKPGTQNIPVIVLSGMEAREAGGDFLHEAYVSKPFMPDELMAQSIDMLESQGIFLD